MTSPAHPKGTNMPRVDSGPEGYRGYPPSCTGEAKKERSIHESRKKNSEAPGQPQKKKEAPGELEKETSTGTAAKNIKKHRGSQEREKERSTGKAAKKRKQHQRSKTKRGRQCRENATDHDLKAITPCSSAIPSYAQMR